MEERIPIAKLRIASANTRKDTEAGQEDVGISNLAQSIREHGLLNPLTVRPLPDGTFEIVAGQRRFLACQSLGMTDVPVVIRADISDTSAVALSLIENVQRADMNPLDKARAYKALLDHYRGNLREVGKTTGVGLPTIRKYLDLLKLPEELHDTMSTATGTAGIGALSAIARTFDDPDEMLEAHNQIGGFTQAIQLEILKRSDGNLDSLPELVLQAQEGAFDTRRCGTGIDDCPHIPDELRTPLRDALRALKEGHREPDKSLKEVARSHKRKRRRP